MAATKSGSTGYAGAVADAFIDRASNATLMAKLCIVKLIHQRSRFCRYKKGATVTRRAFQAIIRPRVSP